MEASILLGDSREVLKGLEAESFDSMVTDPPAGIAFMGSEWDNHTLDGFEELLYEVFVEAYRVLKPGSHILVWSIPRTSHRTAKAIERAGFVIRDALDNIKDRSAEVQALLQSFTPKQVELFLRALPTDSFMLHVFGQGMPKSHNISKVLTKEGSDQASLWEGWGTALRPAVETWWLARKPLQEKTIVDQVLATGTGAINIDGGRIGSNTSQGRWPTNLTLEHGPECKMVGTKKVQGNRTDTRPEGDGGREDKEKWRFRPTEATKRGYSDSDGKETVEVWECHPGCPILAMDEHSGNHPGMSGGGKHKEGYGGGIFGGIDSSNTARNDSGGASRFFNTFEPDPEFLLFFYTGKITPGERKEDLEEEGLINDHPTVKTRKLMAHLVKLITPPGGKVLDPFAGSGSTLVAAIGEGFSGLGVEQKELFYQIATKRVLRALGREQSAQAAREDFDFMMGLESE